MTVDKICVILQHNNYVLFVKMFWKKVKSTEPPVLSGGAVAVAVAVIVSEFALF